ncbi:MAG: lipase family protein, partial [Acidimicrobiales bacterium]
STSIALFDGSIFSGLGFGAIIGISREFPDVDIQSVLTPAGRRMLAAAADMTVDQLTVNFPFCRWRDFVTVTDVLAVPGLREAFAANALGQNTPTAPLFIYHPVRDQLVTIADTDALVETYRGNGASVRYARVRVGEHGLVALTGAPGAVRFLAECFDAAAREPGRRGASRGIEAPAVWSGPVRDRRGWRRYRGPA